MADPFTLGLLLVTFAKSFADQAGSRTADLVFDAATRSQAHQVPTDHLVQTAAAKIGGNRGFAVEAAAAINSDIISFPHAAQGIVEATPGLLQGFLGISSAQTKAQFGKCPVDGHLMFIPPTYLLPDGSSVSALTTFASMRRKSPLMRARCSKARSQPVLAIGCNGRSSLTGVMGSPENGFPWSGRLWRMRE
jgi:hypothetical protein